MKRFLLPFASLLLGALLFPGLCRAKYVNHRGTKAPRDPREESPKQRTNESYLLDHQAKHKLYQIRQKYLIPRTAPYEEPEPEYKIVNCKKSGGFCQEFCYFMETQVGYCSKKKDVCCIHWN